MREPRACGRKYLIGASFWVVVILRRGMKEIILISRRIHIIIQLVDEIIEREEISVKDIKRAENI